MVRLTAELPVGRDASIYASLAFISSPTFTRLLGSFCPFFYRPSRLDGVRVRFTMRVTHLCPHVVKVVCGRAKTEVARVYAKFNVTGMHDNHPLGDVAVVNSPRGPVGIRGFTVMVGLAVPLGTDGSRKYPTAGGVFNNFLHHTVNGWTRFRTGFHKHIIPKLSDARKEYK